MLYCHKKEWNMPFAETWMDLKAVTQSGESQKEQISHINTYMWNLGKWFQWTYLQSRNRNADIENKHMHAKGGEGGWDELGDWNWHIYTQFSSVTQSCLTLCDPIDGSPPGSPIPGILQARTLEWVAISFSNAWNWKMKVKSFSRSVSDS